MGSWFGSKATSGLCQPIIALMPPHDTYIETHLGGGAIMQRKPPARSRRETPALVSAASVFYIVSACNHYEQHIARPNAA